MDKSYVTMKECPICKGDTGSILMDKRLRNSFEMRTINPGNTCDKCRNKYLSKGVLLINPQNGGLVVIKDGAFKKVFDKPIPKRKIAFVDDQVLAMLQHVI